jgi:hypothetical protein
VVDRILHQAKRKKLNTTLGRKKSLKYEQKGEDQTKGTEAGPKKKALPSRAFTISSVLSD